MRPAARGVLTAAYDSPPGLPASRSRPTGSRMIAFRRRSPELGASTPRAGRLIFVPASHTHRVGVRGVLISLVLLATFGAASGVAAQTTGAASVAFLDDRDLTVAAGQEYPITVRNVGNRQQTVSLRFLGFGPPGGQPKPELGRI